MGGEVRKFYDELRKKYPELPEFETVDHELEISSAEADRFIIRTIRNRIKSRVDTFTSIIEDILNPDASIPNLHECNFVKDSRKRKLLELYKKMMYMYRTAEFLDIKRSEKDDIRFIKMYFRNLQYISKQMKSIASVRMDAWKNEISPYIKEEYFG